MRAGEILMEDLKFPEGKIPPDQRRKLSMDEYLEFVLFCRKSCPAEGSQQSTPVNTRFVIRDEDEPCSANDPQRGPKK
jgi:hypothetical protein